MSKLGQNFNSEGIGFFIQILWGKQELALPHLSVQDIRTINWPALKAAGFKGVVFDKDNTLTRPFALEVEPCLVPGLKLCQETFGNEHIALYSNSAGLHQYDPEGREAEHLESELNIAVLRHKDKKPAGGPEDLEAHFGCPISELVMVGDRYLTDVAFGNRLGMLTVLPQPITKEGEPLGVRMARATENYFVSRWQRCGVKPPQHPLLVSKPAGDNNVPAEASAMAADELVARFTIPLSNPWKPDQ